MPHVDTSELSSIHTDIKELIQQTANLIGRFDSHIDNKDIHQVPPCEHHKTLTNKLWGIATMAVAALVGVIYNATKGH